MTDVISIFGMKREWPDLGGNDNWLQYDKCEDILHLYSGMGDENSYSFKLYNASQIPEEELKVIAKHLLTSMELI